MKENKSIRNRRSLNNPCPSSLHHCNPPLRARSNVVFSHSAVYSLRRGLGFWELAFAGQGAVFKHEQGAFYVAHLLLHPSAEPIHGLALALEIKARYGQPDGTAEIPDPMSGRLVPIAHNATMQERSLGLDEAEAVRNLRRKQRELEALLEDEDQIEPVKAEAERGLEAIYQLQKHNAPRIRTSAEKAADAVGKAIKRLYRHLANSLDTHGNPHTVLRSFAEHLKQYLLVPSGRCGGPGGLRTGENFGGCFVYRPPAGVRWGVRNVRASER
jgi:hypothetical protein